MLRLALVRSRWKWKGVRDFIFLIIGVAISTAGRWIYEHWIIGSAVFGGLSARVVGVDGNPLYGSLKGRRICLAISNDSRFPASNCACYLSLESVPASRTNSTENAVTSTESPDSGVPNWVDSFRGHKLSWDGREFDCELCAGETRTACLFEIPEDGLPYLLPAPGNPHSPVVIRGQADFVGEIRVVSSNSPAKIWTIKVSTKPPMKIELGKPNSFSDLWV